MTVRKKSYTKIALTLSICLLMIWALLGTGTTIAWFTDTSETQKNTFFIGDLDLVVGTPGQSSFPTPELGLPWSRSSGMQVLWLENVGNNSDMSFAYPRQFPFRGRDYRLGWHANAAAVCMMGDTAHGPNLLVGCESGNFYFFNHYDLTTVTLW